MLDLDYRNNNIVIPRFINYSSEENKIWKDLYSTQIKLLQNRAHEIFFEYLEQLELPIDRVPQLPDVSDILKSKTGWVLAEVDGLISCSDFFNLLANKIFPSTTYIRKLTDFSIDPDIFHELFGHCPMLLDNRFSKFLTDLAQYAYNQPITEQLLLLRVIWFTIEVGLVKTPEGLRIYGGALLSSPKETIYALEADNVERKKFNILEALRSPYRADMCQAKYFYINNLYELFEIEINDKIFNSLKNQVIKYGEYPAKFKIENNKYTNANIYVPPK
ncbi:phenylalanine 4-monooxygenase [Rickettsiales endosymbiont of Stachyamoeba lipophora]|uniref:phenylalanine 4-monooxygenase n=1 Tax=Rickettsiales endosymbiont of Stachyamoeba lipophora TaxID=2486578 RepID=UPI000F64EE5F|nr:phenylalanine 4-monooxygenase [Rickettsiales endosymbiont of Stachyamoeba lipophora]AZL16359.1 phenylalanine 4-monooxygenase [Rickettsiales endosymbiont of Stachyamoeba lipophora]